MKAKCQRQSMKESEKCWNSAATTFSVHTGKGNGWKGYAKFV